MRGTPTPGEALHEVRKAAKQLRYTAEIGRGEVAHMKKVVRVAKRAQTVLGEHQDTVVTRELCRRLGIVAAAAGENAFTYGRLHALEQARAERTERDFWKQAPKLRPSCKPVDVAGRAARLRDRRPASRCWCCTATCGGGWSAAPRAPVRCAAG